MAITALPTPPSRQDPTNFNDRADAFLGALPTFQAEANALQVNVNTSEVNAVASAAAVLAATNIVKWVSGTTYANGAVVWSPINGLAYRRITTSGSGTTDPSADTTNYKQVNGTGDVGTSGDQTIAGNKTFTSTITGSITGNAGTVTNGVYTTGNQTIGGTKQFTSTILLADNGWKFNSDGGQDTGMYWLGDGRIGVLCNNSTVGEFNAQGWTGQAASLYIPVSAGNSYVAVTTNAQSGFSTNNSTYYKIGGRIVTLGSGAVRIKVVVYLGFDSSGYYTCPAYYKVYKNGVAITGDIFVNSGTPVTWTGDFTCSNGDTFEVYGRPNLNGYGTAGNISSGFANYPSISPAIAYIG